MKLYALSTATAHQRLHNEKGNVRRVTELSWQTRRWVVLTSAPASNRTSSFFSLPPFSAHQRDIGSRAPLCKGILGQQPILWLGDILRAAALSARGRPAQNKLFVASTPIRETRSHLSRLKPLERLAFRYCHPAPPRAHLAASDPGCSRPRSARLMMRIILDGQSRLT